MAILTLEENKRFIVLRDDNGKLVWSGDTIDMEAYNSVEFFGVIKERNLISEQEKKTDIN